MMCAGEGDGGQGKQRLILKSCFKIVVVISCIFLFKIKILEYKVLQDRATEKESWKTEKQALSYQHLAFEGATKNW